MNNLVEEAAKTARTIDTSTAAFRGLRARQNTLHSLRSSLLPVENGASDLDRELESVNKDLWLAKTVVDLGGDVQVMDTAPFGWRDHRGLPKLMPFDVSQEGTVTIFGRTGFSDTFPTCVRRFYMDIVDGLKRTPASRLPNSGTVKGIVLLSCVIMGIVSIGSIADTKIVIGVFLGIIFGGIIGLITGEIAGGIVDELKKIEFSISATFSGIIPPAVKAKIASAREQFECVFILAEVPGLKIEKRPAPVMSHQPDPLVIGYKKGYFFLIAKFDTTTIEALAADEFAVKP